MKTTVMFVADSAPLSGASVRVANGDGEFMTDAEGKIDIDLDLGTHTFLVTVDGDVIERTVSRQGHAPLFVVNVQQTDSRSMNTLNTLQIDLSNLVGDRYVFETVLGRGGMGVVVKAIDRMLNRPVAIKMLSDELREKEEAQQIFLVEARNLATLSHPNLVAIHDILNVGGRVLMVFEYVLGENVEEKLKRDGPLEQKDVLRIGIQLTRCVAYLHEHELIHRDLKPANIIMQADGTLKLIDFGLARSLNELYQRGTRVRGTPAYMAPEQIQGIHLTTATDIYQLGISMYEMLNGRLPFATGDMAYAHVHLQPPPLLDSAPGVDPELARLVHACLEKHPKNRPASSEVLLEQLQQIYARIASGESQSFNAFERSPSGPLPALSRLAPVPQQHPLDVVPLDDLSFADEVVGGSNRGLAVMGVIGLVALAVAFFVFVQKRPTPPAETEPGAIAQVEPEPEPEPAVADPIEQADEDQPVIAARGLIKLGLAAANGEASAFAAAAVPVPEKTERVRPRFRPKPVRRTPARKPAPKPVVAAQPDPKPDPVSEQVAAKPAPPTKSPPRKKPNGLLSVDDGASKSLLPVNN